MRRKQKMEKARSDHATGFLGSEVGQCPAEQTAQCSQSTAKPKAKNPCQLAGQRGEAKQCFAERLRRGQMQKSPNSMR